MKFLKIYSLLILTLLISSCGVKKNATNNSSDNKSIEEKYSHLLRVNAENISNRKLYLFIDEWYGTPYQYGGKTKNGVDCSDFASVLYKEVFGREINGSASSIYNQCEHISKEELAEGDFVFFKIDSKDISHIGIYLQNNKFVHASVKKGIMIDDLDEDYYKKYFIGGGRVK
jgi:lipoprotein Spr